MTLKVIGQVPTDISYYLNNKQVSKAAKDFYKGKFKASDNNKTASIIDSLTTYNHNTRPFYIYLVSKMMNQADGALSEALGNRAKEFFEKHPDYAIDFLYSTNKLVDKIFIKSWIRAIAEEFMIECEEKEKICIKNSLQHTLTKTKPRNKTKLTQFYTQIRNYIDSSRK